LRPDIPLQQIFRGIWPFVIADLVCVLIFTLFPQIVTFLPDLVQGR
jgi:TRAP-type mannitol/chloroaromatic compound transport system permease large subunit